MNLDLRHPDLSAAAVCEALGLLPHPEGGHYRESWRDPTASGERGAATMIFFLLAAGERSHWHRVDASELWLWQAGAPLRLGVANGDVASPVTRQQIHLGPNLAGGESLQAAVPARAWQEAESLGAWSLVTCVVAPAFEFAGFELAPAGWSP